MEEHSCCHHGDPSEPKGPPAPGLDSVKHSCPMHPEVVQIGPGLCPVCGMSLEPMEIVADDSNPELDEMNRRLIVALTLTIPVVVERPRIHGDGIVIDLVDPPVHDRMREAARCAVLRVVLEVNRDLGADGGHPHRSSPRSQGCCSVTGSPMTNTFSGWYVAARLASRNSTAGCSVISCTTPQGSEMKVRAIGISNREQERAMLLAAGRTDVPELVPAVTKTGVATVADPLAGSY